MRQTGSTARDVRKVFLQEILARKEGRAFIQELLDISGVYQASFSGEAPLTLAYNEGRRSIGILILQDVLTADPAALITARIESSFQETETDE